MGWVLGPAPRPPPQVREDLRIISYIREIADERKARLAGLEAGDTPEVLLEKVRLRLFVLGGEGGGRVGVGPW
jgi:hypothetical protein